MNLFFQIKWCIPVDFQQFMDTQGFGIEIRIGANFTDFLAKQDAQWADVTKHYGEK